jgi:hypothetical protein
MLSQQPDQRPLQLDATVQVTLDIVYESVD